MRNLFFAIIVFISSLFGTYHETKPSIAIPTNTSTPTLSPILIPTPTPTPSTKPKQVSQYPLNNVDLEQRMQVFRNKGLTEDFIQAHKDDIRWGRRIPITITHYTQDDLRYIEQQTQLDNMNNKLNDIEDCQKFGIGC